MARSRLPCTLVVALAVAEVAGYVVLPVVRHQLPSRAGPIACAAGRSSPEERERMLDVLFNNGEQQGDGRPEPSTEVPSHLTLQRDEDGEPELARFTYVDEDTCIGCKNCAYVARNTFFMEDSLRGKARVFNQGGDADELIDEAIDTCPVNCIHYVSYEDLVTIESERLSREASLDFNNYGNFKRAWTGQDGAIPETKAVFYGSSAQGARCNNCPSRGCAECPMFGVGQNPIYMKRLRQRERRREASGEAAREAADREAQRRMDVLYGARSEGGGKADVAEWVDNAPVLDAIFGEYSFDAELTFSADAAGAKGASLVSEVERQTMARLREELDSDEVGGLDPYAVLGVKKDASLPEIKRAFRRLAMRWHPDRCVSLPEVERLQAELIFKQVNLASEVLTNEAKRRQFDAGTDISDLIAGFWEKLASRMQGKRAAATSGGDGPRVARGSGVALEELASEEERDSGIQAPLLLSALEEECPLPTDPTAESTPDPPAEPALLDADGNERLPGVKYDYWGRPMV